MEVLWWPYDESLDSHIDLFQRLIDLTGSDDQLYADLTFGSKPTPLVEVMALQYAYRIHQNVTIECVIYSQMDFSRPEAEPKVFDVTALVTLDDIIRQLAQQKVTDPRETLRQILG